MALKPEVKTLWLEALRSGEYQQTTAQLRTSITRNGNDTRHSYCCLGVLCDLAIKAGGIDVSRGDGWVWYEAGGTPRAVLPQEVMEWSGLGSNAGSYQELDETAEFYQTRELSSDNDGGQSFEEIARTIEELF